MFRIVNDESKSVHSTIRVDSRIPQFRSILGARYSAILLLFVALSATLAQARTHRTEAWARDRFAAAERMREALNGRPPADRKRSDYQRVLNAYRNVYYGAPTSTKADPSVVAVAEMLVEMGRHFDDDKILNSAIDQYKFLRKEYPGSKYRCDALFTIGEIYKDDLNDPEQARVTFKEFLHRYPHNRLAEDAQQAIAEMDREAQVAKSDSAKRETAKNDASKGDAVKGESGKSKVTKDANDRKTVASNKESSAAPDSPQKATSPSADAAEGSTSTREPSSPALHPGKLPRVTGIRHWSTPDYTRVAIDLESEVKYGSQRIANPDRIFFDLRDTKLASTLVGKSFDVDDGFLKKIRVAQFQPGRTRVVLEVDNLSDYDAFLLPDPYRLIIDIHGKNEAKNDRSAHLTKEQAAALNDVEAPPRAAKPDVPKSEVKADLKALAGKPVSNKEEIHDNGGAADEKAAAVPDTLKLHETTVKTPSGTIKKVIVEADADDRRSDDRRSDDHRSDDQRSHTKGAKDSEAKNFGKNGSENGKHASEVAKDDSSDSADAAPAAVAKNDAPDDSDATPSDGKPADNSSTSTPAHKSGTRLSGHNSSRTADLDIHEARPTASGNRSLIRALGLKIGKIVIDPGHGGHDTGTIGPNGLQEKDLVLEVGRRLGKLLETRLGAEVVYTRKDDTFIPLETRTAIANQQRADLFISIHANSSNDADARGVETYYLNFTSSPEALEVAARENAVSEKSIYELQDLVKKIALKEKIEESREFAGDVQESLHAGLAAKSPAIRDRGVKKAPFIVLIGANMPSILAEISFVSNPTDERRLETAEYRQKIAESLYRGVAKYVNGLSGVKLASKIDKPAGQ
jgi:N-acetylmuramoyl-L-alanine amidase